MERPSNTQTSLHDHTHLPHVVRTGRDGMRRALPMTALINFGLHYSQRWPIRDLSPNGAYVEMPGRGLKDGMNIEFVLRLVHDDHAQELRLPANVVRVDDHGAAVTFGHFDDSTYTSLINLLYSG